MRLATNEAYIWNSIYCPSDFNVRNILGNGTDRNAGAASEV